MEHVLIRVRDLTTVRGVYVEYGIDGVADIRSDAASPDVCPALVASQARSSAGVLESAKSQRARTCASTRREESGGNTGNALWKTVCLYALW